MRRLFTAMLLMAAVAALAAAVATRSRVGHPVTPRMRAAAVATAGRAAYPMTGVADAGPTVVVFIRQGCPCSEAVEPYMHRLFDAYGDRASVVGVIDGGPGDAEGWRERHRTPYPIVADPDLTIVRAYGAERSAYTALVVDGRTIERLWPGYSAGMLRELGARLAAALGVAEAPLDVGDAPEALTSGCPFDDRR
jgi:AhpC/TSA family